MEDAIEQVVSYFRHAAQGLEEKKQILYLLGPVGGGKSSIAERLKQLMQDVPFYAIKGSPVNESPLGLFDAIEDGPILEKEYGIPRRYLNRDPVALGGQAAGGVRRRHPQVQGRQAPPVDPEADRHRQDRAGRREQPGHQLAGRQGRHPQARDLRAGRPRRLQLLRRPVPGEPGPARVRRDVQGADQGAAPAADGHAGGQLQGHRRLRRDPVRRHRAGAQQRERVEGLPQQQEQRGLPRPHLHRQGAVLPARVRGGQDLREADAQLVAGRGQVRARHAEDDEPVRGADAAEGAGELVAVLEDAGLRRREPEGHRPARQELPGVPRLRRRRRGHERHLDALRLQDHLQGLQLRQPGSGGQPGAPDVRARAADRARAVPDRDRAEVPRLHQGAPGARATPSSSARRSRPPTSRATASTARTSSTATSPTPTTGSRTTSTATPTPARCSTAAR